MFQKRLFPILWLILGLGFSPLVHADPDAYIFFQPLSGNGSTPDDKVNITKMLTNEIAKQNCVLLDTPHGTDYILFGALAPYYEGYEDMFLINTPTATTVYSYNALLQNTPNAWESWGRQLHVFHLILRNTATNENIMQQSLIYQTMDDVYNFFPLLMYNLFTHILGSYEPEGRVARLGEDGNAAWRDKWLYLRLSAEWPITFYLLQPNDLHAGTGVYSGTPGDPDWRVSPQDNKSIALPGGTFGVEFQFLNWMSIESTFQVAWEALNDKNFIFMAAGAELKFPLKFSNIVLAPYGAVSFPVSQYFMPEFPEIFDSYPLWGYGGGVQLGLKAGPIGALFVDINYMFFDDVGVKNPYGELYPIPDVIHYKRSSIGIGLGLKVGFWERKKKEPENEKAVKEEKK